MQLSMASEGDIREIFKMIGRQEETQQLQHLGFLCGEKIKIISVINGIFVLEVKGSRLAIDKMTASKILVH